jgi:DNA-binding HxlR family transcriptional regulator
LGIDSAKLLGMKRVPPQPELTPCTRFHRAIELIGRRWTGAIVFVLLRSRCRYATLRDSIPEITDRMLSERLQELEREGIVERTVVPDIPVRVEYSLTKKGRDLASAIDAMAVWAEHWLEPQTVSPNRPVPAHAHPHAESARAPSKRRRQRA